MAIRFLLMDYNNEYLVIILLMDYNNKYLVIILLL